MSRFPRPSEFWRVIATAKGYRRERVYKGPGGKKKAMDFATHAKNNGALTVVVESSIPSWTLEYFWDIRYD